MSEEEFFNRLLNKIAKNFGYDVASTLELMFFKKNKELDKYKQVLDKIKEIVNSVVSNNEVIDQLRIIEVKKILELLEEIE